MGVQVRFEADLAINCTDHHQIETRASIQFTASATGRAQWEYISVPDAGIMDASKSCVQTNRRICLDTSPA